MSKFIYPNFSNGTVSLNGELKASTSKKGNEVSSNFHLSDFEEMALNYAQENFAKNLKNINTFSPETLKSINTQVNTFKNNAIKEIDSIYNPMINDLKNDIAARFGSFNNSAFLNDLNNIESNRKSVVSSLAQDVESKRNELETSELTKRYDFLKFLSDYQNNLYDNVLNFTDAAQSNSEIGNSYSKNLADSYLYAKKLEEESKRNNLKGLMSALKSFF